MEVCDSVNIYLFAKEKKVSGEEVCKQTSAISKKKNIFLEILELNLHKKIMKVYSRYLPDVIQ